MPLIRKDELEAALWALIFSDWSVQRASLEEDVEGWQWTGPTPGYVEIGDWDELPPVPDDIVNAYREWKASR